MLNLRFSDGAAARLQAILQAEDRGRTGVIGLVIVPLIGVSAQLRIHLPAPNATGHVARSAARSARRWQRWNVPWFDNERLTVIDMHAHRDRPLCRALAMYELILIISVAGSSSPQRTRLTPQRHYWGVHIVPTNWRSGRYETSFNVPPLPWRFDCFEHPFAATCQRGSGTNHIA